MIRQIKAFSVYIMAFILPVFLYSAILMLCNIYPFGTIKNLVNDLSIQYLDLYAYFQNVMRGDASLSYSFTKSLGGSAVGLYAYYLASPVNLLLSLFSREDIPLFVYMASIIKLGLSGVFQAYFLRKRFDKINSNMVVVLSLCYALSYYLIHQIDNLMWLDGIYMLPLILYGVWRVVKEKKGYFLSFAVAASIFFNWYTAYMNCLFAVLYFIYEYVCENRNLKGMMKDFVLFSVYMVLGILLSSALFLPTVYFLLQGKGSVGNEIWDFVLNGNLLHILRGFVIGNDAGSNNLSLFCGSIVFLMATIGVVLLYKDKRKFFASIVFLTIMVLSLIVKPMENIWNGFRFAMSYFYRFSFLQTWLLIYFAATGLEKYSFEKWRHLVKTVLAIVFIWIVLNYMHPFDYTMLKLSVGIIVAVGIGVLLIYKESYYMRVTGYSCLLLVTIVELLINGTLVSKGKFTWGDIAPHKEYVTQQAQQIEAIRLNDENLFYRIEQTLNQGFDKDKCSAFFLENMGYNYWGFSHYSSVFNEKVRKLGESFGYGKNDTVGMYDEPILTSDSLLGIKYVLSDIQYPQLNLTAGEERNGKKIYINPYALPLGFLVSEDSTKTIEQNNHFLFQNQVFSNLLGEYIELYEPVGYRAVKTGDSVSFDMEVSEGCILYGYADSDIKDLRLFIDDQFRCGYEKWLSYKVFNISDEAGHHVVRFDDYNGNEKQIRPQFYQLNLSVFQRIIEKLKQESFNLTEIRDGYIKGDIYAQEDGLLMLTVPEEKGWKVTVNGENREIQRGVNALICIPISGGTNYIELSYTVPFLKLGIMISILTLLVMMVFAYLQRRKDVINYTSGI